MAILDLLEAGRPLVSDGATGTMLQSRGLPPGELPDLWNLTHPDDVREVHAAYVEAGSDMVCANTFGGARIHLERVGHAEHLEEINQRAVHLAREAASGQAFVVCSIGPLGEMLEPYGEMPESLAAELFAEQLSALSKALPDAVLLETFYDIREFRIAAVEAARTGLPVIGSMTFTQSGRTITGATAQAAAEAAAELGLAAFGVNCGTGPEQAIKALEAMAAGEHPPFLAQPNAGLPEAGPDGTLVYSQSPQVFAEYAPKFRDVGCAIIGGCCGSTPGHIRAVRTALGQTPRPLLSR